MVTLQRFCGRRPVRPQDSGAAGNDGVGSRALQRGIVDEARPDGRLVAADVASRALWPVDPVAPMISTLSAPTSTPFRVPFLPVITRSWNRRYGRLITTALCSSSSPLPWIVAPSLLAARTVMNPAELPPLVGVTLPAYTPSATLIV